MSGTRESGLGPTARRPGRCGVDSCDHAGDRSGGPPSSRNFLRGVVRADVRRGEAAYGPRRVVLPGCGAGNDAAGHPIDEGVARGSGAWRLDGSRGALGRNRSAAERIQADSSRGEEERAFGAGRGGCGRSDRVGAGANGGASGGGEHAGGAEAGRRSVSGIGWRGDGAFGPCSAWANTSHARTASAMGEG